jgi:hypothetical protein
MYIYIKAVTFVVKRGKMAPNKLLRCKNVGALRLFNASALDISLPQTLYKKIR